MKILVMNAGSSSLKYELFLTRGKKFVSLFERHIDNHGKTIKNFEKIVSGAIQKLPLGKIDAVGHRVVHGGEQFTKPAKITSKVLDAIRRFTDLAPLHNPPNLACIEACVKIFPKIPHVAVFDTSFHQTMPEKAFLYGLPYSFAKKMGIRRYGFHGTSHQYVFEQARKKLGKAKTRRTITCHLGNGCSLAAILDGKVIDTSMGFTPLEGVPMGTRSGDLDPAIIFHLLRKKISAKKISDMLHAHGGLLGVSEISSDMRDLWAAYKKKNAKARRSLEWFCYRIAKYIGAYAAALGGLDCLVFTGGIGERAWYVRKWILAYLKGFRNKKILVIPTDEEKKIAEETARVMMHS